MNFRLACNSGWLFYTADMNEKSDTSGPNEGQARRATTNGHRDARAEALQKALRDNLRRRKAATTSAQASEDKPGPSSE